MREWDESRRGRLDAWTAGRPVIPFDPRIAQLWGELTGQAKLRGRPRPQNHTWIAACCLRYGIPLVALNTADFGDFAVANLLVYTLTVNSNGNGTVTKMPDQPAYPPGSGVTLTANPATGWMFTTWSGDATGSTNPLFVTMNANKTITATFVDTSGPTVTVTAPNGSETYQAGHVATVQWTASGSSPITGIDLLLSRAGSVGPFEPIITNLGNAGSYGWTVSRPATSSAILQVVAHDAAGRSRADLSDTTFAIQATTGVDDGAVTQVELSSVWPNPIGASTALRFALPLAAPVRLSLIDLQGREVATLAERDFAAGRHEVRFRGNERLEPGLYFARLQVLGRTYVRKFVLSH